MRTAPTIKATIE